MNIRRYVVLGLSLLAATAHAQKLSPGLWEMSMDMKAQGGEMDSAMARMQAEMAKMSPEERKQVEAMMAQRGIGMAPGGKGMAVQTCISKERAERGDLPEPDDKRNCKRDNITRTGSTMKFKMSCTNPPSSGEGEFTFTSDKAFTGRFLMETQVKGKPERVELQQQGKWLSADCGALKPR